MNHLDDGVILLALDPQLMHLHRWGTIGRPHHPIIRIIAELHYTAWPWPRGPGDAGVKLRGRQHLMKKTIRPVSALTLAGMGHDLLIQLFRIREIPDALPYLGPG